MIQKTFTPVTLKQAPTVFGMSSRKICIGLTVYNGAPFLEKTLESLLAQTTADFRLFILDDGSQDGSFTLVKKYAEKDSRIGAARNEQSMGLINAWKTVFLMAERECPDMEFFAWASDHDLWDSDWLRCLLEEFKKYPESVLCYPVTDYISEEGTQIERKKLYFETGDLKKPASRFLYACGAIKGAGNMIYGLFRAESIRNAGIFREILLPDRFLILEISLQGSIRQVRDILWHRRILVPTSIKRQRERLFSPSKKKPYKHLPWWLLFTAAFLKHYVLNKNKAYPFPFKAAILSACLFVTQVSHDLYKLAGITVRYAGKRMLGRINIRKG